MKKDSYTVEFDFTNEFVHFEKVLLKQVIYRDDRLYQTIIIEWKSYQFYEIRKVIKSIENDRGIMDMLSKVGPFTSYGFVSNKLAIKFKKDLKFSKMRAKAMLNNIIKKHLK